MIREEAIRLLSGLMFKGELKEALDMAIKALEQQEPCENVPELYECPCGYGWDKNKVVRHHFCPNCGRAVDGSIKTEQEPCEDCISRQAVIDCYKKWQPYMATRLFDFEKELSELPSVTPQPKMGRWIEHFDKSGKWYECDQCHTDWGGSVNYCPNCGAKM